MPELGPIAIVGIAFAVVYGGSLALLALYGLHSLWLLHRFHRTAPAARAQEAAEAARPSLPDADLPAVLVQLPVFNERDVVHRICQAAGELDWPRDRLHIQLLDDSTDDSVEIGRAAIAQLRAAGLQATHLHRDDRSGFKAGALEAGMQVCDAPYIAIFDADFIPRPDFLRRAIVPLLADPDLALVQGRWEHHNPEANRLTAAQSIGIDAHFAIEQSARAWSGLAMNFNGTCGLWRRAAIQAAGGWEHETLTEDLDLSYRAQLAGWRCTYRMGLAVPGELPADIDAFRAQQFRWAKGSQQCTRKLMPRIWRSGWPLHKRIAALLHMSHYAVHPLMLVSLLCAPVALWLAPMPPWPVLAAGTVAFLIGVFAPILTYIVSQRSLRQRPALQVLRRIPVLAAIGTGIAVSNARAVWEAWLGVDSPFVRTPKSGSAGTGTGSYRASRTTGLPEIACGLWAMLGIGLSIVAARPWATPLLVIYSSGFLVVGMLCLRSWLDRQRQRVAQAPRLAGRSLAGLGAIGLLGLLAYGMLAGHPQAWMQDPLHFAGWGLCAGAAYLAAVVLARGRSGAGLGLVIAVGCVCALGISLGLAPSDDLNRYIVEGRQVALGQNPYQVPPMAVADGGLPGHRIPDEVFAGLNHPDWTAIYPPGALYLQALVAHASTGLLAMRLAALAATLLAVGVMAVVLLQRGRPIGDLILVAWNPVLPLWLAGEGHNDAFLLPLLALAILLLDQRQRLGGVVAASLAALVKPFAVWALLPPLLRGSKRLWLLPPLLAALAYLPFAGAGLGLVHSLGRFGAEKHFHGAIDPVLRSGLGALGLGASTVAMLTPSLLIGLLVFGAALLIWRDHRRLAVHGGGDAAALTAKLLALFFLCLPTLHPWYLASLVLLLPMLPHPALLLWTAMTPIYWLHGLHMQDGVVWAEVPWVTALAHAPCLLLLGWDMTVRSKPWRLAPAALPVPTTSRS
ncbi:MAG: glycosyltransferase [Planctomycetota bacterium]